MSKPQGKVPAVKSDALFDRIVTILEQARGNVVRAVNANMVLAYWLIGREIVEEAQRGKERAKYGEKVVENLSKQLTERYGQGFSVPSLKSFRNFYQAYPECSSSIGYPMGSQFPPGFSPQLSWSHYRALMRVENREARDFYEREAIAGGWDKRTLERQIQSFYYERILKSRKPEKMLSEGRNLPVPVAPAAGDILPPPEGDGLPTWKRRLRLPCKT